MNNFNPFSHLAEILLGDILHLLTPTAEKAPNTKIMDFDKRNSSIVLSPPMFTTIARQQASSDPRKNIITQVIE